MPEKVAELLTVEEVAETLRIKPKRVYELPIRKVKVGRRVRYHAGDVKLYLAQCDERTTRRAG